jgi:DNA-binding transcriptional LysR family regulator
LKVPQDLIDCNCLLNLNKSPTGSWVLEGPDGPVSVKVKGSLKSDFGDSLKDAAIAGMGISMHPYYMIAEELQSGLLQVVLPDFPPTSLDIYAIHSSRKNIPAHLRLFLDFLRQWATRPKAWEKPVLAPASGETSLT